MKLIKTMLAVLFVTALSHTPAFAIDHDETFPRMLSMITSALPEELEGIKDNFCKRMLAATMTASDIRGRAAELATDDFPEQEIFDRAGVIAVQFSTVYANICK